MWKALAAAQESQLCTEEPIATTRTHLPRLRIDELHGRFLHRSGGRKTAGLYPPRRRSREEPSPVRPRLSLRLCSPRTVVCPTPSHQDAQHQSWRTRALQHTRGRSPSCGVRGGRGGRSVSVLVLRNQRLNRSRRSRLLPLLHVGPAALQCSLQLQNIYVHLRLSLLLSLDAPRPAHAPRGRSRRVGAEARPGRRYHLAVLRPSPCLRMHIHAGTHCRQQQPLHNPLTCP